MRPVGMAFAVSVVIASPAIAADIKHIVLMALPLTLSSNRHIPAK
jgi:hypothetical protein